MGRERFGEFSQSVVESSSAYQATPRDKLPARSLEVRTQRRTASLLKPAEIANSGFLEVMILTPSARAAVQITGLQSVVRY
jgi:hypothetical protein